jgi:putative membrane protein
MPWLKLLHISAVILWCGALLYLPAAIAAGAGARPAAAVDPQARGQLRALFTLVATPAALVAIVSGTSIFLLQGPVVIWLLAKLAVVGLLVLGHALCGMLILRVERQAQGGSRRFTRAACAVVGVASLLWLGTIAWLVLAKPF